MRARKFFTTTPKIGATVLVVALAVCSSGSSRPALGKTDPVGDARKATLAAGGARIEGQITAPGTAQPVTGVWEGDTATGQGDVKFKLSGSGGPSGDVEIRWVDKSIYLKRLVATEAFRARAGVLALLLRPATEKPWSKANSVSISALVTVPFDPPAVLQRIEQAGGKRIPGTTTINGTTVIDLRSTKPIQLFGWWENTVLDAFVDTQGRVVRIKVVGSNGGVQYDVKDYGMTVKVVPPPTSLIASTAPPVAALNGPYAVVRTGTTGNVSWKLLRATAKDGSVCWRFDATPPMKQLLANRPDGAQCLDPPAADAQLENTVQFVVDASGAGPSSALGVTLPAGVKSATLGFVGGRTQAVPVTSPIVWVGPGLPVPGYLGIEMADGRKVDCGAGAIGSIADLTDSALTARAATAPWLCTAAP